jgi:D-alanine--poly(phosphoribitol) ligase subunit 1
VLPYSYNLGLPFLATLERDQARPALCYADKTLTYADLSKLVDRLGVVLMRSGLERGDVIAIGHTKRPLSYALMLAALRLGVAYVNIDVTAPAVRTASMLSISGASMLYLDNGPWSGDPDISLPCPTALLDEASLPDVTDADRALQLDQCRKVDGAAIAYVMFTSGSTGAPKGVAVTHQNVLHFIAWGKERFGVSNADCFANLSPMYFDNSVFDFFIGLYSGASLCPISRELLSSPYHLVPYVEKLECTIWFSVPSLLMYATTMKALGEGALPHLRTIVFGGEGYPKVELKKLYDRFQGRAALVNVYGPTECTCICSAHTLSDSDFISLEGLPTLGRLNPNFDCRVIDEDGRDAMSGELCLIGPNVASGYFNDPDRTAAAFVTLTDANRFGKRMYRTGDLVQRDGDMFHFLGRKDNQIKHMGHRIELEEIELAIAKVAGVDQAVALYHRVSTAYGKIIGFAASTAITDGRPLLKELARTLPDYMIPSRMIMLPELPKNPNGKVDRNQLRLMLDV